MMAVILVRCNGSAVTRVAMVLILLRCPMSQAEVDRRVKLGINFFTLVSVGTVAAIEETIAKDEAVLKYIDEVCPTQTVIHQKSLHSWLLVRVVGL